jgi:hypothetical protein
VTCQHGKCHPGKYQDDAQHQHAQAGQGPGVALGHLPVRQLRACGGCSLGSHLVLL